jgi:hypothetical protein
MHDVKTSSGVYPVSYLVGASGSSPDVKRPKGEADPTLPSSAIPPIRLYDMALGEEQLHCFLRFYLQWRNSP